MDQDLQPNTKLLGNNFAKLNSNAIAMLITNMLLIASIGIVLVHRMIQGVFVFPFSVFCIYSGFHSAHWDKYFFTPYCSFQNK